VRKQRIPIMTALAFGFIAICIVVIGAWDIFTEARSQTPGPQGQMSPAELGALAHKRPEQWLPVTLKPAPAGEEAGAVPKYC
jgi:hypothetical protein